MCFAFKIYYSQRQKVLNKNTFYLLLVWYVIFKHFHTNNIIKENYAHTLSIEMHFYKMNIYIE